MNYRTPGVYIEEISKFPPSVAQVETAIPAFIGYTQKAPDATFPNKAVRITSMTDYEAVFGGPFPESFAAEFETVNDTDRLKKPLKEPTLIYRMYYAMQLFFANGGGPCYIISVGNYDTENPAVEDTVLIQGLDMLKKEDEPTLILFPDAVSIEAGVEPPDPPVPGKDPYEEAATKYYTLYVKALALCEEMKDRFTIIDVFRGYKDFRLPVALGGEDVINDLPSSFRNGVGTDNLKYGAGYYPWLETILEYAYDATKVKITGKLKGKDVVADCVMRDDSKKDKSLFHLHNGAYQQVKAAIEAFSIVMPPGPVMAGIYARVDNTRGVWKAPANVSVVGAVKPTVKVNDDAQNDLNVHFTGKSINAIRSFIGKGIIVWGARTLAGNDNEWRYVPVRRFFNMAEESVKKASEQFVFEPNDANTWVKVKAMIENFLLLQWRAGALAGAVPEQAFYVKVGLGETMTALDILEGRMNVEIGMAVVRPAEFIILKFSHKMQES